MKPLSSKQRNRGQIIVLFAFTVIVLIGSVGLAVDSGRAYGVKAKLNAAVDAAAIAAARALSNGADDTQRIANATVAGTKFFHANFPDAYLGSYATPVVPSIQAVHDPSGYWTVNVSATTEMPTTFMRVLNPNDVNVGASAQTIRRDVDIVLVLDTSGSLAPPNSPSNTFPDLKTGAKAFVDKFSSGHDRVALVSFSSGAVLDVAFNNDFSRGFNKTQVKAAIDNLTAAGSTATAEGMRRALDELNRIPANQRSSLRAIVFFSDGAPNGVPATFARTGGGNVTGDLYSETSGPSTSRATRVWRNDRRDTFINSYSDIATLPSTGLGNVALASYSDPSRPASTRRTITGTPFTNTRCNVNRAARNMVENVAHAARGQNIVIHGIPYGTALDTLEIGFCGYGQQESGRNILKRLCNTRDSDTFNAAHPVGICPTATTTTQLQAAFDAIASELLRLAM